MNLLPAVVIDTSAIIAILRAEPEAGDLSARAVSYIRRLISTATWLESAIVCESKVVRGGDFFDQLIAKFEIEIVPFSVTQARLAREAHRRYGKGRRNKAQLSHGDCFVYALAKELGAPVLFKGADFAQTDIEAA